RTIPREGFFLKKLDTAYIAGFFDGDGSVRLQLQPRDNAKLGFRVRTIISIAQKVGHEKEMEWIRRKLGIGYIYTRKDEITELKIEGFQRVKSILTQLKPYVRFKSKQVGLMLKALNLLEENSKDILAIAKISDEISDINYATTKKKYTAKAIKQYLKKIYPRND
ncbi:MAG: LAGLIDADG family homing endonuclease, partial [Patescibacteria group bacterium]